MLMISEKEKVFLDQVCSMMTAKTREEFERAKKVIQRKYNHYMKASKPVIKLRVDSEFILDPRKYSCTPYKRLPTMRDILAKEKILQFEHDMESLTMFMCFG